MGYNDHYRVHNAGNCTFDSETDAKLESFCSYGSDEWFDDDRNLFIFRIVGLCWGNHNFSGNSLCDKKIIFRLRLLTNKEMIIK